MFLINREGQVKKLKTRRGAAKRFTKTAKGYLKAHKGGHSHLLSSKNRKRKRSLKEPIILKSGGNYKRISTLMPYQ